MRSSFCTTAFVLQPLFARTHRVKPGKKAPLRIRVLPEGAFLGEI